jgi:hypothetical protein
VQEVDVLELSPVPAFEVASCETHHEDLVVLHAPEAVGRPTNIRISLDVEQVFPRVRSAGS